ncbi:MAG: hypothetical protein ACI9J2_000762 [Saprospiraceae bacterium]
MILNFFIKFIALLEFLQGALCLTPIFIERIDVPVIGAAFLAALSIIFFCAGLLLYRGTTTGIVISFLLLFPQLFVVSTAVKEYKFLIGPGYDFFLGNIGQYHISINVVALVFCLLLALKSSRNRRQTRAR